MIIGVSPFSEAVPGKSSLESLHSKSYAILLGLRVPRTKVAVHLRISLCCFTPWNLDRQPTLLYLAREPWNIRFARVKFFSNQNRVSACKIIVKKKKKKHSYSNSKHSNSYTIKKSSAILSRIYSRNISISFHPLSKPPYRSLTKRRNLPFLYSIVIIPKKESVLVVVPLQQGTRLIRVSVPSKETVHTVRVFIQFVKKKKNKTDISSSQRGWYFFRRTNNSLATNLQRFLFFETWCDVATF